MSALDSRTASISRRLRVVLLLIFLWDLLAFLAALSFGGPLMKISGDSEIGGLLAARASFNGALVVPLGLYLYAIVRGPLRHRGVLWLAALEQGAAALLAVYHTAANDIKAEGMILPLVIASLLLAVVLLSMPRGQTAV